MRSFYFSLLMFVGCLVLIVAQRAQVPESEEVDDAYSKSLGYGSLYPRLEWEESLEDILDDDELSEDDSRMPAAAARKSPSKRKKGKGCRKGVRKHPVLGICRPHLGIDYKMPVGTPLNAKQSGTVVKAGWGTGFGKVVGIRYGGCTAIYAHMSVISVRIGQKVKSGQRIGKSGNTGLSSGPHLHYEKCSKLYASTEDFNKEEVITNDSSVIVLNSTQGAE